MEIPDDGLVVGVSDVRVAMMDEVDGLNARGHALLLDRGPIALHTRNARRDGRRPRLLPAFRPRRQRPRSEPSRERPPRPAAEPHYSNPTGWCQPTPPGQDRK